MSIGDRVRGIDLGWPEAIVLLVIIGVAVELFAPGIPRSFVREVVLPVLGAMKGLIPGTS